MVRGTAAAGLRNSPPTGRRSVPQSKALCMTKREHLDLDCGLGAADVVIDRVVAAASAAGLEDQEHLLAAATPYLKQFGNVAGGCYLARGALAAAAAIDAGAGDKAYLQSKIGIADFYADNYLSESEALTTAVTAGASKLAVIDPELLSQ